jgi:hypothetical protein
LCEVLIILPTLAFVAIGFLLMPKKGEKKSAATIEAQRVGKERETARRRRRAALLHRLDVLREQFAKYEAELPAGDREFRRLLVDAAKWALLNGEEAEPRTELERQMLAKKVKRGDDFLTWVVHNMAPGPPREQPLPPEWNKTVSEEEVVGDAAERLERWWRETHPSDEGAGGEPAASQEHLSSSDGR